MWLTNVYSIFVSLSVSEILKDDNIVVYICYLPKD